VDIVYNIESDLGSAMGIRLCQEQCLENPILVASWPEIGNIGIVVVDALKGILGAGKLRQIKPWQFLYPKTVLIRQGILQSLESPSSQFKKIEDSLKEGG